MVVPAAPTAGDIISEAWGDLVHDNSVGLDWQSGRVLPAGAGSGAVSAQLAVTFPRAFAAAPTLILATENFNWFAGLNGNKASASAFTCAVNRTGQVNGAACWVDWIAYGPRLVVPNAPTLGEPIAEAWGDVAHDTIVAMDVMTGVVTPASNAGEVSVITHVNFPRLFGAPPIVGLTTDNFNGNAGLAGAQATTSGFDVAVRRSGGNGSNGYPVRWIAYGPRATFPTPPTAGEPIAEAWGDIAHAVAVDMELQFGNFTVGSGAPVSTTVPVTFPHAFAAVPEGVWFQNDNFNSYAGLAGVAPTATGFSAACRRPDGGATGGLNVQYVAYGKRA